MDNAHAPATVLLDAKWEVVPAQRLGPGRGGGVEVAPLLAGHAVGFALGLGLALAKGISRLPRLGHGGVPAPEVDDVEQVAGLARQPVLPHDLRGARELLGDGQYRLLAEETGEGALPVLPARQRLEPPRPLRRPRKGDINRELQFEVADANVPAAVLFDALWQKVPAQRLGAGRERGVEVLPGLGLGLALKLGFTLHLGSALSFSFVQRLGVTPDLRLALGLRDTPDLPRVRHRERRVALAELERGVRNARAARVIERSSATAGRGRSAASPPSGRGRSWGGSAG